MRTLQYVPELSEQGFEFAIHSLFGDAYLEAVYRRQTRPWIAIVSSYLRRLAHLIRVERFDVAWVEKEVLPWMPGVFERLANRIPTVLDYDDAIFHRYDQHPSAWVRAVLGRKIDRVMARASTVVAGSQYLAQRATKAGARRLELIPTSVDTERYRVVAQRPEPFTVGWIGTPKTAHFLAPIAESLRQFYGTGAVRYRFVGAPPDLDLGVPYEAVAWSEQTEVAEVQRFSCGIMPLIDGPFERGKCGYKLIQYMACGLPVIASPVGANLSIVKPGESGFLPRDLDAWLHALVTLKDNPELAECFGRAGRTIVEREYNARNAATRLARLLKDTSGRG